MTPPLDLTAISARIHELPACELTPIALALVAEVRRLRDDLEAATTTRPK